MNQNMINRTIKNQSQINYKSGKCSFLGRRGLIKRIFMVSALFCVFWNVAAEIKEYKLSNGIPVYINDIKGNRIDCLYIIMDGGVVYLSPEFSGLEDAVTKMMLCGSKKYSYAENMSFAYETLSSFHCNSSQSGSTISVVCIDKNFDEAFNRLFDGFLNPTYEKDRYDDLMRSYTQEIQQMMNEPSSLAFYYAEVLNYAGHPFETFSSPTESSLPNITISNIKKHHDTLMDSRRIKIVACGDYEDEKLIAKLENVLGAIKSKSSPLKEKNVPPLKIGGENGLFVNEGATGTGFLLRTFESPSFFEDDYASTLLASQIFEDIMYNVVREKNGICYTPTSGLFSGRSGFGYEFLYRTSDLENFPEALDEARSIFLSGKTISGKDSKGNYILVPLEEKLEGYKNRYVNNKYQRQTTTSGIAGRICSSLLAFDNPTEIDKITEKAINTSSAEIIASFKKYWIDSPSRWICVTGTDGQEKLEKTLDRIK